MAVPPVSRNDASADLHGSIDEKQERLELLNEDHGVHEAALEELGPGRPGALTGLSVFP